MTHEQYDARLTVILSAAEHHQCQIILLEARMRERLVENRYVTANSRKSNPSVRLTGDGSWRPPSMTIDASSVRGEPGVRILSGCGLLTPMEPIIHHASLSLLTSKPNTESPAQLRPHVPSVRQTFSLPLHIVGLHAPN